MSKFDSQASIASSSVPQVPAVSSGGAAAPAGKAQSENLPAEQRAALELLLQGRSVTDTAQSTGVSRRTVYRWMKKDPAFQAVYNQWHDEMKESCRSRLLMLSDKATSALEKALEAGDAKSALQLLKGIGLLAPIADRPTDEQEVRKQAELDQKRRRNDAEIAEVRMRSELAAQKEAERIWSDK